MKNEVGVPLFNLQDLRGMDRIFSLSKFVVETFRLTSIFFMTVAIWRIPWRSWDFFKGETFSKNKYERKWERPERKAEYGEIIVEV